MKRVETKLLDDEFELLKKLAKAELKAVNLYVRELILKHLKKANK